MGTKSESAEVEKEIAEIGEIIENMGELPEVTESIIPQTGPEPVDSKGRKFSSDLHDVGESGAPIITTKGTLKLKKRGRPSKAESGTGKAEGTGGESGSFIGGIPSAPEPENPEVVKQRALGVYSASLLISMGRAIGGEEWEPTKDGSFDERRNLESAFGDYYVAKNMGDIPAGVALTMAVCAYIGPRLFMPTTQKRVLTLWDKIKVWLFRKKLESERKSEKGASEI